MVSLLPSGSWFLETHFITWIYHSRYTFPCPVNFITSFRWFPCALWSVAVKSFPSFFLWSLKEPGSGGEPLVWEWVEPRGMWWENPCESVQSLNFSLSLCFFPCKVWKCPLAQNSTILGFLCTYREESGKNYNVLVVPEKLTATYEPLA